MTAKDAETECRVSYRDAKEMMKKVERPYQRAMMWGFAILIVLMIAIVLMQVIDWIAPAELSKELMHLVDTGQITEDTAHYLFDEGRKSAQANSILSMMCSFLVPFMMLSVFKDEAVKKALKEENERRSKE